MSRQSQFKSNFSAFSGGEEQGPSVRQLKVGEEIRRLLAQIFSRFPFRDPILRDVEFTITEARMSPDLKSATVFVTHLGHDDIETYLPALKKAAPFLRGELAHAAVLRSVPKLQFQGDASLEQATHIESLLDSPQVKRDLQNKDSESDFSEEESKQDEAWGV
ncbi:30S ribosome-binding factor RbfA [Acetobacteraceae bacterium]|nr:30S ribosome-binding factor RbfA [Acetobacteraceae bacterium]